MNQKNSLGLDICFKDEDNPFILFKEWFDLAKEKEPNDPNALALATSEKEGNPKRGISQHTETLKNAEK